MTEKPMGPCDQPVSRRGLLGKSGAAVAGAALAAGLTAGAAEARTQVKRSRTYEVAPDMNSFTAAVPGKAPGDAYPSGPFYIHGPIFKKGGLSAFGVPLPLANAVGTYRAWGWIFDPKNFGAVASQTFEIGGDGEIYTRGYQNGARFAVVGGTGPYKDVRGEGVIGPINPANLSFRITFTLF